MSGSRETSTMRHRLGTSSQSSDEFLQQFPAPPVPQHFSDMNAIDNHGSHQLNKKTCPESNAVTLNNYPKEANAFVQSPNENGNHSTNHQANTMLASTAQRKPSIPNAYALNTDFTFVDRPEKKEHWTKRNCFFRWICCTMCFPPWVAYILWFIVIAVIICIIVIGAILGSFKMPTIDFAGLNSTLPNGTQQIEFSGTGVLIHTGLILNVINRNILNMKLSSLTAKAYYPINGTMVQIGKGYLDYQFIPKKSDINFTYPFQIDYNPSDPNSRYLLSSISDKCGFTGNTPSDIDISYDVSLSAQVLFVHVSPTISSSASFACPFQKGQIPGLPSTGSSGQGGLNGILGGLGAQANGTSSSTAHTTARATALPPSLLTTARLSTMRAISSSITPTLLPTTAQSTHISASIAVHTAMPSVTSAVHPSLASPSTIVAFRTASITVMTSAPLLRSTFVASLTSSALSTTSSAAAPTLLASGQPRVMPSSTTIQPTSRTTSTIHTSSNPATLARSTSTIRSSTIRPAPTPEDDNNGDDDDDQDDGDDGYDGDDDDDDGYDGDNGDDDSDDQ